MNLESAPPKSTGDPVIESQATPTQVKQEVLSPVVEKPKEQTSDNNPTIKVENVDKNETEDNIPDNATLKQEEVDRKEANKENLLSDLDLAPPTPTSVPVILPFTSEDTIKMDTSNERKEDDISLIVHVDESQNEFDMPETPAKGTLKVKSAKAEVGNVSQDKPAGSEVGSTDSGAKDGNSAEASGGSDDMSKPGESKDGHLEDQQPSTKQSGESTNQEKRLVQRRL